LNWTPRPLWNYLRTVNIWNSVTIVSAGRRPSNLGLHLGSV
jgi:hypothetical protein